jgi:hypothetical protein
LPHCGDTSLLGEIATSGYAGALLRVAVALSVLVVVAWGVLIVTTPSDPQIGVAYLFTTLYALVALITIWTLFGFAARRRRRRRRVEHS